MSQADQRLSLRRISIVGITGSGKTYLAQQLSARLGLPVIELDSLRDDAVTALNRSQDAFGEAVRAAVESENWIIDGHYRAHRDSVWNRADLIIHLDYPLPVVLRQIARRYRANNHAREHADTAQQTGQDGARSLSAPASASWRKRLARLAKTLVERREYARLLARLDHADARVKRFSSQEAVLAWIESL